MSAQLTNIASIDGNQTDHNAVISSTETTIANSPNETNLSETNPILTDKMETNCNTSVDTTTSIATPVANETPSIGPVESSNDGNGASEQINPSEAEDRPTNNEQPDQDDSSSFSMAFTITFDDSSNTSKKLGIRDSIRKFAPPKPHTIEKPRPSKSDQCPDSSIVSVESEPAGLSKYFSRKGACSSSSRSSSRRSGGSSRHSNISESAAFLIDKMLNCKRVESSQVSETGHQISSRREVADLNAQVLSNKQKTLQIKLPSSELLDHEVDFCDDKSDNGTYIVGADPESDAARKKIDELFGVAKAAEASAIKDTAMRRAANMSVSSGGDGSTRQSRLSDKKSLSRERQEHLSRLAVGRNSSISRSSSSSRQDNNRPAAIEERPHRSSSKHSRNSSCDRAVLAASQVSRPRRSASQSSRHSRSSRDVSDVDSRSSRSSLNNTLGLVANENVSMTAVNHPSMKFNRAFALRRARLGLGEPTRAQSSQEQTIEAIQNQLNTSQRRHQINTNTYRVNQTSSPGSVNFCRDDGGRFSLRMKQGVVPGRLNGIPTSNRSPQHSALLDNYLSKVAGNKISAHGITQPMAGKNHQLAYPSTALPYQSGDELEATTSPSRYRLLMKAGRLSGKKPAESEGDSTANSTFLSQRFNFPECEASTGHSFTSEGRASSSSGRQGSNLQLGALDSLVISAISSLSAKIRHSVCDLLMDQAKKLPIGNETRLIVEEILPQLTANSKSPTSLEEIDQSLYFDLAKTLKNLKKVEQMVDVITLISYQLPTTTTNDSSPNSVNSNFSSTNFKTLNQTMGSKADDCASTSSDLINNANISPV